MRSTTDKTRPQRIEIAALALLLVLPLLAGGLIAGAPPPAAADAAPNTIDTIVGDGTASSFGDCQPVRFSGPYAVALDSEGNLYVADTANHRVRRVTPEGQVTTVAGNGIGGLAGDGGPATLARLNEPNDLAFGPDGILYIADTANNRVRRVDADGVITTVAGSGTSASPGFSGDGGPATAAELGRPRGLVFDGSGNLFLADSSNHRVRRVDAVSTDITTIAGTGTESYTGDGGPAAAATLDTPGPLVIDDDGNLIVADTGNFAVRRVDAGTGDISTVAGNGTIGFSGDGGPATAAQLRLVGGLEVDPSGNLYIADSQSHRIRRVDSLGTITTIAGSGNGANGTDGLPAVDAVLNWPSGLERDPTTGDLYIADRVNNRIRAIQGTTMNAVAGDLTGAAGFGDCAPATTAAIDFPVGVAYDSDFVKGLLISELGGDRVRRLDNESGTLSTFAGTGVPGFSGDGGPATAAQLNDPAGIVSYGNDIYIADSGNNRVRKVDFLTGIITTVAGTGVAGTTGDGGPAVAAQLNDPTGVARDFAGNLYVTELEGAVVRRIDRVTGTITTIAGNGVTGFGGDGGPATAAELDDPVGVAVDLVDQETVIYVADSGNERVRRIAGDGTITTIAGTGTPGYSGDNGPATAAQLNNPAGLAVDPDSGDLLVTDALNQRVRRIAGGAGEIRTVAGTGAAGFSGDGGPATSATFDLPFAIAISDAGELVVADAQNHRVRRITSGTSYGYLRVTTSPALPTEIIVDGVSRDSWGLNWVEFPAGQHEVCFGAFSGWTRPACQDVVVEAGQTTEVVGTYTQRGYLQIATSPALPATILVDGTPRDDWGMWMDFAPGDYEVCFGKVADWEPPPCQDVTVTPGATTPVTGTFISDPGAPGLGAAFGNLRVTTDPAVAARIQVDGVPRNAWGLSWLKLAPGDHEVCFGEVLHTTAPDCHTVTIVEGATTTWVGTFEPKGFLQVNTSPAVPATIFVDGERANAWGVWNALPPGEHEVCFGDVPGLVTPPCETATVDPYVTTSVTGTYTDP